MCGKLFVILRACVRMPSRPLSRVPRRQLLLDHNELAAAACGHSPAQRRFNPTHLAVCVTGVLHGRKRWYVEWWLSDLHDLCTRFLSRSPEYQHNTCMILQSNDDTLVFRRKVLGGEFSGLYQLQGRKVLAGGWCSV